MNFFEEQKKLKADTTTLVILFILAVLGIILAINSSVIYYLYSRIPHDSSLATMDFKSYYSSIIFSKKSLQGAAFIGTIIYLASLFQQYKLRGGGSFVAIALGGDEVFVDTATGDEKRFINIVEEMSIASGCPIPRTFVLNHQDSINAFAAGHDINDAAIAISKGALNCLTRDELQAVVAHEYGHIFNGDMRLNIKISGYIFGLLVLAIIGRSLMPRHRYHRSSSKNSNQLMLAGLALYILGYIGVFFGSLIKSYISKKREFLADACSVQYTRNPDGITGVLKKIYVHSEGSMIATLHADEYSHLFFASAVKHLSFSSHPPLFDRIRSIDKNFKVKRFIYDEAPDLLKKMKTVQNEERDKEMKAMQARMEGETVKPPPLMAADNMIQTAALLATIGNPSAKHLDHAKQLIQEIPPAIYALAQNRLTSPYLLYFLFMDNDPAIALKQREIIGEIDDAIKDDLEQVLKLPRELYLPLVDLALPTVKLLQEDALKEFIQKLKKIIQIDNILTRFEFIFYFLITKSLRDRGNLKRKKKKILKIKHIQDHMQYVLSFFVLLENSEESKARQLFNQSCLSFKLKDPHFITKSQLKFSQLSIAFNHLAQIGYMDKKQLIKVIIQIIQNDNKISLSEKEALRAFAATLSCPIPPLIL